MEQLNANAPKPQSSETLFLSVVFILAIAGLVYLHIANKQGKDYTNSAPIVVSHATIEAKPSRALAQKTTSKEKVRGKLVTTTLQPEAFQEFTFRLTDYSKNTLYQMDTGDGKTLTFKDGEANYTYKRSGNFYGKLYATYNGKTITVDERMIQVAPGIVTAPTPSVDY